MGTNMNLFWMFNHINHITTYRLHFCGISYHTMKKGRVGGLEKREFSKDIWLMRWKRERTWSTWMKIFLVFDRMKGDGKGKWREGFPWLHKTFSHINDWRKER